MYPKDYSPSWFRLYLVLLIGLAAAPLQILAATPPTTAEPPPTNHLAGETSPYLLLHAHNPVEWYPWGPEALERARREDKPIFLSVGYSTCYWCHVMERLVFTRADIAAQMNQRFINIKVDREERPDLDRIYMTATHLMTGHGGWPNSVFLTPDLEPFFAGTYFPPEEAHGRPSFPQVMEAVDQYWTDRRAEVLQIAARMTELIREYESGRQTPPMAPDSVLVNRTLAAVKGRYDTYNGGFGGAPKFPPSIRLEALLEAWKREDDQAALDMASHTLEAMALGGIYDHVGGGFHRYATDAQWHVPHFEKMLYNQAQLAANYTRAYQTTGEEAWRRKAADIFTFVAREMTHPDGGFYSALDAETEAVEGLYYLWTREAIEETLGTEAEAFFEVYDLAPMPEGEGSVLYQRQPLEKAAQQLETTLEALLKRRAQWRERLLAKRTQRLYPLLDDKVLTAWNGMMIGAYAQGYQMLGDPTYRLAAERAAEFVLQHLQKPDGGLQRVYRLQVAKYDAYLEDYAFLAQGLLQLYRATDEPRWLHQGQRLADAMVERFWDQTDHGFFFVEGGGDLIVRSKNAQDAALPSANAVATHVLLELAQLTGQASYHQRAGETLFAFGGVMHASPAGFVHLIGAAQRYLEAGEQGLSPLALSGPAALQSHDSKAPAIAVRAFATVARPTPGQDFHLEAHLQVPPGWHINANPASAPELIPTSLTLNTDLPLELVGLDYPPAEPFYSTLTQDTLAVYQNDVALTARVRLEEGARLGQQSQVRLLVQYQACDDSRCLPPAEWSGAVDLQVGNSSDR
ncbi:MAG: DUF255 domain-containing protein [Candidatus Latescibacteria bacterium]|nr:DUF255 domain-containing protein [Candidatus Latescibacterota bacterium]